MEAIASPEMVDVLGPLPTKQRARVMREVASTLSTLDREINRVLRPTVGRSESGYVVADDAIPLYGVGSSPAEAMKDYRSVVIEYYEGLEADASELGQELRRHLELLRPIVEALSESP